MPIRELIIRALVLEARDVPLMETIADTRQGVRRGLENEAFDLLEVLVDGQDVGA